MSRADGARLSRNTKLSLLTSAGYPEFSDRRVGVAGDEQQALLGAGSVHISLSIRKVRTEEN